MVRIGAREVVNTFRQRMVADWTSGSPLGTHLFRDWRHFGGY
jgi:hypothetical protein